MKLKIEFETSDPELIKMFKHEEKSVRRNAVLDACERFVAEVCDVTEGVTPWKAEIIEPTKKKGK